MHLRRELYRSFTKELTFLFGGLLFSPLLQAGVIPASTPVEVRLSEPSGSRISHVGDAVSATVIAPVFADGRILIPPGAIVSGEIQKVGRLGYGLKHVTSDIQYAFKSLQLPDGTTVPIEAIVKQVETAKERVNAEGVIGGIYPTANLSSSVAPYLIPLLWIDPHFGLPFLGIKVMIARSPDPEIYFPAGTEFVLELTAEASVPYREDAAATVPQLSTEDMAEVHQILVKLPQQRTNRGPNHPSDLVNILFLGNREAVDRAFHAAGWAGAQRWSSLMSIYRMYHCMVQRVGYTMAPMGALTLNGLRADAEYQKSLDTFSKRHHVRLWRQAGADAFLSSATEDVNYGVRHMHLTHVTDPVIDNERNKVLNDVAFTGCLDSAGMVARAKAEQPESSIETDGKIAVLRLNDCREPRTTASPAGMSSPPESHTRQALVALRNDLIRTNPVFLTYNTMKVLCDRWQARGSRGGSGVAFGFKRGTTAAREASGVTQWLRPSVLGTKAHVN